MTALRPYQSAAFAGAVAALQARKRPLVVMPTGAGKTVTFAHLAREFPGRVRIVAHRRELLRQASAKLAALGLDHGVEAPGFDPNPGARVQVASVQTLAARGAAPVDLQIEDEAHHAVTASYRKARAGAAAVVGFTATPERLDGTGLADAFDRVVAGPTIPELVTAGHLAPCRVYAPAVIPDPRGVAEGAGAAAIVDRPSVTGDAIEHYAWHAPGQPAIAFCASVEHARHVAEAFSAAGWRSAWVAGSQPAAERDARIAGLASGAVEVLTACDLISEGLDVPAVGAVILLRPTASLGMYLQMVGRGMRPAPGKDYLAVLDHVGNAYRHGLPDAARAWTLEGASRTARDRAPALRQCSACYAIHAAAARCCPACGEVPPPSAAAMRRRVRRRDGTLAELTDAEVHTLGAPLRDLLREARSRADIEKIAEIRGYAPGWVHKMMQFRQGRRPRTTAAEDFT